MTEARAARGIEFVFEPIDALTKAVALAAQPIALPFGVAARAVKPFDLLLLPFKLLQQVLARCGSPAPVHTQVMPRRREKYKYETLDLPRRVRTADTLTR